MEMFKLENRKYIVMGVAMILILLVMGYTPPVIAENGWITEAKDGYYPVGNNLEVKMDIVNGNLQSIDNDKNLFYNGEKVYIKLDWRAVDTVTTGTSLTVELPIQKESTQVCFESPLTKNLEIVSDDGSILTALKKDGRTITTFFDANPEKAIAKDAVGTILVPHNVFVNHDASKVIPQTMQITLLDDSGRRMLLTKQVDKVANGLQIQQFAITDKSSGKPIDRFVGLDGNNGMVTFQYESGAEGIQKGDVLQIQLSDYVGGDQVGKIIPLATSAIDLRDDKGTVIGTVNFYKSTKEDSNNYIRVEFNDNVAQATSIKGSFAVYQEIAFQNVIEGKTRITIHVNGEEKSILVNGPSSENVRLMEAKESFLSDVNVTRKDLFVNLKELQLEQLPQHPEIYKVIPNMNVEETLTNGAYAIDTGSIRIVRMLSANGEKEVSVENVGLDASTLQKGQKDGYRIGHKADIFEGYSGLTVTDFEKSVGRTGILSYQKDDHGNVVGFTLDVGNLNNPKGVNGEYVMMSSNGDTTRIPKDNKPFGYLIYYNMIEKTQTAYLDTSTSSVDSQPYALLRLIKVDLDQQPLEGVSYQLTSVTTKSKNTYNDIQRTNASGYVSFPIQEEGTYRIKELGNEQSTVEFVVNNKNHSNLDLKLQSKNKDRVQYQKEYFVDKDGVKKEEYVNVMAADKNADSGRFKIEVKDKKTKNKLNTGTFQLYTMDGKKIEGNKGTLTVDSDGVAMSELLPVGKYYVLQSTTEEGYKKSSDKISVEIEKNTSTKTFEVWNESVTVGDAPVQVTIYDGTDHHGLEGSVVALYKTQESTSPMDTITIQKDGVGVSKSWPYGTYYLEEVKMPEGYEKSQQRILVPVNAEALKGDNMIKVVLYKTKGKDSEKSTQLALADEQTPLGAANTKEEKVNPVTADSGSEQKILMISILLGAGLVTNYGWRKKKSWGN